MSNPLEAFPITQSRDLFEPQRFEVWYARVPKFFVTEDEPLILDEYVKLGRIAANSRDDAFRIMQGEVWSPNGEARELILDLGLYHTSMSVGDVLYSIDYNLWLRCMPMGWQSFETVVLRDCQEP